MVGVVAATERPERFAGLAATNSFAWPPEGRALGAMLAVVGSRTATATLGTVRLVPRLTRGKAGVGLRYGPADRRAFFGPYRQRGAARNFHRAMRSARQSTDLYAEAERRLRAHHGDLPLLTVFGEKNDPFGFADRWGAMFPNAWAWTVPGGNHFPMCDDPDGYADHLPPLAPLGGGVMIARDTPLAPLAGRTALVTGGTRGIGRELVAELARRGAIVHFCGRSRPAVTAVAAEVEGAVGHLADLAIADDRRALAEAVLAAGALDVLVNNAGIGRVIDLTSTPPADPGAEIEVNLVAPIDLTLSLLPHLRRRPGASIVNVGSALAYVPMAAEPVYCASKAGLHSWSRSLRQQLGETDIEVIEALLPTVDTDMASIFDVHKITAADAARQIVDSLGRGDRELRIGQGRALYAMSRLAPHVIFRKLNATPIGPPSMGTGVPADVRTG